MICYNLSLAPTASKANKLRKLRHLHHLGENIIIIISSRLILALCNQTGWVPFRFRTFSLSVCLAL